MTIEEMKYITIDRAMKVCRTNSEAAKKLGITEKTLYNYLDKRKQQIKKGQ
jgi:ActR/RegA family two-component response regulator